MDLHELKTWPGPFDAIVDGRKRYDVRRHDRGFRVGDMVRFREWHPNTGYSGREVYATITHLTEPDDDGLPVGVVARDPGVCVFGIAIKASTDRVPVDEGE
jgi:hypothetical protein